MKNVSMGMLLLSCLSSYATLAYAVYFQLPPIMLSNGGCAAMATCLTLMKALDVCKNHCCGSRHDESCEVEIVVEQ